MTQTVSPHEAIMQPTATVIDARPMLRRSDDSLWERTEQLRRQIASAVEAQCASKGIEALVLQSDAYVHPAWVKFECWMPHTDDGLTARSTMTVTITAVPCHRFEAVYRVDWEKHGRTHTVSQLHTFGEAEIAEMVPYLCGTPVDLMSGLLPDRAVRLLKRVRLRQAWWQFWKPRNKIATVRRDRLQLASGVALGLGVVLMIGGVSSAPSSFATTERPDVQRASPIVVRPVVARAMQDQPGTRERTTDASILEKDRPGMGTLDDQDPRRAGNEAYELWSYLAAAGEPFAIAMESSNVDSFLVIGVVENGAFTAISENDDYGGQTHARVEVTAPEAREYLVLASSYGPGATGDYTLRASTGTAADVPQSRDDTLIPSAPSADYTATSLAGMLLFVGGLAGLVVGARAPRVVRSAGKPMAEPRILYSLDSWQTVVFGAGQDAQMVRDRLIAFFNRPGQNQFTYAGERVWYWGLDGKTEREQLVLRYGRALVFCQIHQYGTDLYVGWNAQMNLGTWQEKKLASGVDVETGERVRLMTIQHAVQPTNDYDLTDLNSLAEWTHAQVTTVLKVYLKEREIDQEIDFAIIRGQREGLKKRDEKNTQRRRFQRKA